MAKQTGAAKGTMMTIRFDEETYDRLTTLAISNFPKPSGGGNVTHLIRHLALLAYDHPDRFNLRAPAARPPHEEEGD